MKYNSVGKKRIVYCILNRLDRCDSLLSKDLSINTIDFLIRGAVGRHYDVLVSNNEHELLSEAVGYSHAVVVSTGTYLWASEKLFDEVEKLCKQDFFIAGHVLDRGDDYLELHEQFYIINLQDYAELGHPDIGNGEWFVDNAHEEYIPIVDAGGTVASSEKKVYKSKLHGWNVLKIALENSKKVIDVGSNIRSAKRYLYQEHEHVFINHYPKIFHLQLFARNVVAHWNSDHPFNEIPFDGPVEQYITVGTGLNWIRNLVLVGYTKDTTVTFTDINYNCLRFMKELVTTWDGVDYDKFYHAFEQFYPSGVPESVFKGLSADAEFAEFKKFFDDWPAVWNSVKQLTFNFRLIDYTADYDLSWIAPGKRTLINFSDLFNFASLVPTQSVKFRVGAENRLLDTLNKIDPNITVIFTSRAATGYKTFTDGPVGVVKDFKLTNIEDLKMLPWHIDDWQHSGRRPLGL